jgi:hypothetical protein
VRLRAETEEIQYSTTLSWTPENFGGSLFYFGAWKPFTIRCEIIRATLGARPTMQLPGELLYKSPV